MKRSVLSLIMSFALVICLAPCAFSDSITLLSTEYANGTGFGNVTNVLSLHAIGTETGSVTPTSVANGDATNTSKTWTASELTALGFTAANLAIVFNPAQTGSSDVLNLLSFSLDFYDSSGASLGQALLTNPTNGIIPLSTGTGTSGYLMSYNNSSGLLDTFFATGTNVLGGSGSISNANGGQDNFYLANLNVPPPAPVPIPAAVWLFGSGLLGLFGVRRKIRK